MEPFIISTILLLAEHSRLKDDESAIALVRNVCCGGSSGCRKMRLSLDLRHRHKKYNGGRSDRRCYSQFVGCNFLCLSIKLQLLLFVTNTLELV